MEVARIEGTTRVLGKSQGYYGLPVRDELVQAGLHISVAGLVQMCREQSEELGSNAMTIGTSRFLNDIADAISLLPVHDGVINDSVTGPKTSVMTTAWTPNEGELIALNNGANIHVTLVGRNHPPIMVKIGPMPK